MDLPSFRDLLSAPGQAVLQAAMNLAPREEDFLQHFTALSQRVPADLARAALEIAILRQEAEGKFPFAKTMFFTREALEQASSWEVSTYRAQRFHPFRILIDLGCSIGGDTLALASLAPTLGIDLDPLRLAMAQANLQALGLDGRAWFLRADLSVSLPISCFSSDSTFDIALFFDPARRSQGRRAFSVRDYRPPLRVVLDWLGRFPALGVKISPGVNLQELAGYDAEVEFISLHGELKEAVLWFGPLKTAHRRATVLPGGHTLTAIGEISPSRIVTEPRSFLYEPDPSILRAGLVTDLAILIDAYQLDPAIAYLSADQRVDTPFARSWAVEDWFPFGLKRLRAYLRARGIGHVVVKKRGSPLQPEALIQSLHLKGESERTIFLTQLQGKPIVILAR